MRLEPALLLVLDLDRETSAHFEQLRQRFFPADRNRVPAHLMLFHRLSLAKRAMFEEDVRHVAASSAPFDLEVGEPYSIGRGVAYTLRSIDLMGVRTALAQKWNGELIAQDREPYRPHVVVQNKVSPEIARETLDVLSAGAPLQTARATGLTLWSYRNGKWEDPARFPLKTQAI